MKESSNRAYKNIDNLMLAVKVGKSLGDSACTALYECGAPDSQERGIICNAYLFACGFYDKVCFNNAVQYCSQRPICKGIKGIFGINAEI